MQGAIASWIGQVVLFGSPQVDHAAIDFQIDFVQMPGCVRLGPAFDSIGPKPDEASAGVHAAFGRYLIWREIVIRFSKRMFRDVLSF